MTNPRATIFDAVRAAAPGAFKDPGNIHALDNLLDAFGVGRERSGSAKRRVADAGEDLIKRWESCSRAIGGGKFQAYPDPGSEDGKPWTIGWGSTGAGIGPGTVWTQQECNDRFANNLQTYADEVSAAIGDAPTTQNQFDALVSFHYNTGKIGTATLTKKHRTGDYAGAKAEFARYIYNDGQVLRGLVRRRAEEAELYWRAA